MGTLVKPMLAQEYSKRIKELPWNNGSNGSAFAQPKLDGIRCLATPNGLFSRTGEEIVSCEHIADIIIPIAQKYGCIFDGELYNHQLKEDFNQIASLVRKTKNIEDSLEQIRSLIQYHIYDIVVPDMDFRTRQNQLLNVGFADINAAQVGGNAYIFPVSTYEVTNQDLLDSLYGHFLEDGYEGQMVRANSAYEHKRSPALLKRKEFESDEFEILDVLEGEGNRSGMAGKLLLKGGTGTFKSNLKGNCKSLNSRYKYSLTTFSLMN
jgi:DNA ligase-1